MRNVSTFNRLYPSTEHQPLPVPPGEDFRRFFESEKYEKGEDTRAKKKRENEEKWEIKG
jgi:hypothetical protein